MSESLKAFILFAGFIVPLLDIAVYLIKGIALYQIAKKQSFDVPALAFAPLANQVVESFVLGNICNFGAVHSMISPILFLIFGMSDDLLELLNNALDTLQSTMSLTTIYVELILVIFAMVALFSVIAYTALIKIITLKKIGYNWFVAIIFGTILEPFYLYLVKNRI